MQFQSQEVHGDVFSWGLFRSKSVDRDADEDEKVHAKHSHGQSPCALYLNQPATRLLVLDRTRTVRFRSFVQKAQRMTAR